MKILAFIDSCRPGLSAISAITAVAILSGCAGLGDRMTDQFRVNPVAHRKDPNTPDGGTVFRADNTARTGQGEVVPFNLDDGKLAGGTQTALVEATASQEKRNRLQDHLVFVSDQICGSHKAAILANSASINLGLSSITTLLGGIGAMVTGADAARILAGSAGITNAFRSGINEHVYQNLFTSAILRQIDSQREKKRNDMNARRSESTSSYTVEGMIRDVHDYHEACSFYSGLTALADDKKRAPSSEEITGRIEALRSQMRNNDEALKNTALDDKTKANLTGANNRLSAAIAALTMQLSLLNGAPPPADAAVPPPPPPAKAPADGANKPGGGT